MVGETDNAAVLKARFDALLAAEATTERDVFDAEMRKLMALIKIEQSIAGLASGNRRAGEADGYIDAATERRQRQELIRQLTRRIAEHKRACKARRAK